MDSHDAASHKPGFLRLVRRDVNDAMCHSMASMNITAIGTVRPSRACAGPQRSLRAPASGRGVALALAVLVLNDFQPWGQVLGTVLLGSIVVNEMIGPVLFRTALQRAGEIPEEEEGEAVPEAVASA